ncbi:radical SAM protein [Candidatus Margulisiibacteriota bacterium]
MSITWENFSIENSQQQTKAAQKLKKTAQDIKITNAMPQTTDYLQGKKNFHIKAPKGSSLSVCASLNEKYICCNVHVLNTISNCPFSCSYCFLQNYLNSNTVSSIGDLEPVLAEIKDRIAQEPNRLFRIGTWELGDSLATEHLTSQAAELIKGFTRFKNAILDLRTKSDNVDSLLSLNHEGKTIISWTISPQAVIDKEEKDTASLENRLTAMKKVADAGYLISLHFDPMILYQNWEADYKELVKKTFQAVPGSRIAWISLGSLRFNPEMKKKIKINFPGSKITAEEMVLGSDGKIRYVKPKRVKQYQTVYQAIKNYGSSDILVHLCMERWDMWEKIFGNRPESIEELDYLFAESLFRRFGIFELPDKKRYF